MKIKLINSTLIYLFSFFLGFGKFDPFGTNGLYFDVITVLVIFSIALTTDVIKKIKKYRTQLSLLFSIGFILFFADLFYGIPYFNFKYYAAIIIFWFFSYFFSQNPKIAIYSILLFSLSSAVIAALYNFGYLNSYFEVRNGRLLIFEENPNSIGTRMAIAFIILTYFIIVNPLNFSKKRYLLALTLPSIFLFVIATASKGSFLALIFGIVLIGLLANIHKGLKVVLIMGMVFGIFWVSSFIETTSLIERFISSSNLLGSREEIWSNAIQIFYDNPFGVGEKGYINEMITRYSMRKDTHNLFLQLLIAGGFLSLFLFLFFLYPLFKKSYRNLKKRNPLLIIIFLILIFIAAKTGGVLTYLIMWYFFAVINSFDQKKIKPNELYPTPRLVS